MTDLLLQTALTLLPAKSQAGEERSRAARGSEIVTVTKGARRAESGQDAGTWM